MRTRLLVFAATVSIAGLAAASPAVAAVPSGSPGGGVSMGAGGAGHAGGGGGGGAHFSGGGGHSGSGYRSGGSSGGFAVRSSYRVHGGYVAHGSYTGFSSHAARGGYRIIGTEWAGLARASAPSRGAIGFRAAGPARITLALGPRTGSAATAMRLDHLNRINPRPGHPPGRRPPRHQTKHVAPPTSTYISSPATLAMRPRLFCDPAPRPDEQNPPCLQPVKEPTGRGTAVALPH